ncbi:aspartate dehydrogenase [Leeia sp. TBRC 13508]|uniref:L-aspartate dehydrogenase n=1 Tax=Leeia speluncae TaxID=2884804 RepID=A0ABS8D919_9NEIS|nr:aspartate dehydrogenase [Leeia speluncae]MCB6184675.1 aspartate dehydrogenase [Leeia speluncae]
MKKTINKIVILGLGAIGRKVLNTLKQTNKDNLQIAGFDHPARSESLSLELGIPTFSNVDSMLNWQPDLVIECAGHQVVAEIVPPVLNAGVDVVLVSVGALSDHQLFQKIDEATQHSGAELVLVSGAIGGLDALRAARSAGIHRVTYTGRKPPHAWVGTPAETLFDLNIISQPTEIFSGNALESAQQYPKNANVTAAVAMAGIGFEKTSVKMIADPTINKNVHELTVVGEFGEFSIRLENNPLPENPKTSWLAALSIEEVVKQRIS